MKKLTQTVASMAKPALKFVTILLGLAGLTLVIAWISGVFVEKIPPGESRPVVRMLAGHRPISTGSQTRNRKLAELTGSKANDETGKMSQTKMAKVKRGKTVTSEVVDRG